jgi:tetratricopeptide (TPR) repeat protein
MLGADIVRRLRRGAAWLAIAVLVPGLYAGNSRAQLISGQDRAQLTAEQDKLFQQMLREPGNLDVAFAYASVSARLGDNEAAVTALERMLLFNPNLPRIDLELGALYFRMGSFDLAGDYLIITSQMRVIAHGVDAASFRLAVSDFLVACPSRAATALVPVPWRLDHA